MRRTFAEGPLQEAPEHQSEQGVARRLLRKPSHREGRRDTGFAARRMLTVDDVRERKQREVLGERQRECDAPRGSSCQPPRLFGREAEEGTFVTCSATPATGQARVRVTSFPSIATSE